MQPKATPHLLVEEVNDETLVYDLERHRAHCLNATSAFLLRSADGTRSPAALAALAEAEFGAPASLEVVNLGLERLRRAGLLAWDEAPVPAQGPDRRQVLKRLATFGLLLPTVFTLVSPSPAQAATLIAVSQCDLQHVGMCCSNNKLCVQVRNGQFKCQGPAC